MLGRFWPILSLIGLFGGSNNLISTSSHLLLSTIPGNHYTTTRQRCACAKLVTLRNHDDNANENVAWKYKFALFVLLRDYSNSFTLYSVVELHSNRTDGNGVQVDTENGKLPSCAHVRYKTLNLVIPRFCLAQYGELRNVPKFKTHVHGLCFLIKYLGYCFVTFSLPSSPSWRT